MDRRNFGKNLLSAAGVAGLGSAATQAGAAAKAPDMPYRVFPDLKVIRNDKIRAGGDYWIEAGSGGMTSAASLSLRMPS